jgi:hypothetical protein
MVPSDRPLEKAGLQPLHGRHKYCHNGGHGPHGNTPSVERLVSKLTCAGFVRSARGRRRPLVTFQPPHEIQDLAEPTCAGLVLRIALEGPAPTDV